MRKIYGLVVLISAVLSCITFPARAAFHVFGINEVYSNPSGTIQFIELHDRFGADSEGFFNGVTITSNAKSFTFPSDLPNQATTNKFVLLATAGYAAIPGVPAPNYTIPAGFFNPAGDTLNYGFGADIINFGPVPTNALQSLNRVGAAMVTGTNTPTNFAGASGSVPEPGMLSGVAVAALFFLKTRR